MSITWSSKRQVLFFYYCTSYALNMTPLLSDLKRLRNASSKVNESDQNIKPLTTLSISHPIKLLYLAENPGSK